MDVLLEIIASLCLFIGSFICISGGVGILRFPDFYTRMHAVGVTDTLGAGMILIGLMFYSPDFLTLSKLLIILLLTLLISPTTSHVLAKAAMQNELKPKLQQKDSDKELNSSNYS